MRALLVALTLALACAAGAQPQAPGPTAAPSYQRIVPRALAAEAKVSEASALSLALERVPGGQVRKLELERDKGRLIYSFDITVAGKPGTYEVEIDALTGAVVRVGREP